MALNDMMYTGGSADFDESAGAGPNVPIQPQQQTQAGGMPDWYQGMVNDGWLSDSNNNLEGSGLTSRLSEQQLNQLVGQNMGSIEEQNQMVQGVADEGMVNQQSHYINSELFGRRLLTPRYNQNDEGFDTDLRGYQLMVNNQGGAGDRSRGGLMFDKDGNVLSNQADVPRSKYGALNRAIVGAVGGYAAGAAYGGAAAGGASGAGAGAGAGMGAEGGYAAASATAAGSSGAAGGAAAAGAGGSALGGAGSAGGMSSAGLAGAAGQVWDGIGGAGGLAEMAAANYQFQQNQRTAAEASRQFDPYREAGQGFLSQLQDSYTNPEGYLDGAEHQAIQNTLHNQLSRADAAGGRNSNSVGRQVKLQESAMANLANYRQGLNQAAMGSGNIATGQQGMETIYNQGQVASPWVNTLAGMFGNGASNNQGGQ